MLIHILTNKISEVECTQGLSVSVVDIVPRTLRRPATDQKPKSQLQIYDKFIRYARKQLNFLNSQSRYDSPRTTDRNQANISFAEYLFSSPSLTVARNFGKYESQDFLTYTLC